MALQEVVPSHQKQSGTNSAQGMEAPNENEAKHQEAVASVKQCRAGKPQFSGVPEAKLDKLTQKLSSARCGHWVIGTAITLAWSK